MKNILIGKILSTHNLKGDVKLLSYCENPEDIFNFSLYDKNNNEMKFRKIGLTSKKNIFLAKLENSNSIEEARKYINSELFIKRENLEKTKENETYINDLFNMKVDGDGKIGIVENVYNYGAGDVIEIRWEKNNKLESIPFNKNFIKEIKENTIYINLPSYI